MPFLAPLVPLIAGAASFASAAAPLISAGAGIAGIVSTVKSSNRQQSPQLIAAPTAPNYSQIQQQETQNLLRTNQARTKTILTSPLGVSAGSSQSAPVQRKKLLGQ